MAGEPKTPPVDVTMRRRGALLVGILVCLGLPFAVVSQLYSPRSLATVPSGNQPGGNITGRLVTEDDRPVADHTVELHLVVGEGRRVHGSTRTDAQGLFEITAPPIAGHYLLEAGGGEFQRVVRGVSYLTEEGEVRAPEPLELVLPPGATLRVTLTRADGRPVSSGTLYLEGRVVSDFLFGLVPVGIRLERSLDAGSVVIDGLPSARGDVRIVLENGDRVEFPFELEAGQTLERAFEL